MVCHNLDMGHHPGRTEADSSPAGSSDADGVLVEVMALVEAPVVLEQAVEAVEVAEVVE